MKIPEAAVEADARARWLQINDHARRQSRVGLEAAYPALLADIKERLTGDEVVEQLFLAHMRGDIPPIIEAALDTLSLEEESRGG